MDMTLDCKQCGGSMENRTIANNSQTFCVGLIVLGVVLCFFSFLVGAIAIVIGLFMGCGSKKFWVCQKCETKIEKV